MLHMSITVLKSSEYDIILQLFQFTALSYLRIFGFSDVLQNNLYTYVLRSALFWVITKRILAIPYRRFGTTFRSHLQGQEIQFFFNLLTLEDGRDRLSRNVGKELPL
jgi:hypothetical protein